MDDQRSEKRTHLLYYPKVYDRASRRMLGHAVDLSSKGMMLMTHEAIPRHQQLKLWLEDVMELDTYRKLNFSAESRWYRLSTRGDCVDVGFRFLDSSPEFVEMLETYQEE